MKYSGQKFFILFGLFLIPILFIGSLLREPAVNRGLLRMTLSLLKTRMGAPLGAQRWKVDLSKFAVAIEGLEFRHKDLLVSVNEFRAEFSPLFLFVGRVHLTKVWLNQVLVTGDFSIKAKKTEEKFVLENFIQDLTNKIIDGQKKMDRAKMGFEVAELSSLSIMTPALELFHADLKVENFGVGHVKIEVSLEKIKGEKIPEIERLLASAVIYQDTKSAYISLRRLNLELENNILLHTTLEARGRIPGELSIDLVSELSELKKWLKRQKQKELLKFEKENNFGGYIELRGNLDLSGAGVKSTALALKSRDLVFDVFNSKSLNADFSVENGKKITLKTLEGAFHGTKMDAKKPNRFLGNNISWSPEGIEGSLQLQEMGLCALLRGLSVGDCYLDVVLKGDISLKGTTEPFRLTPELNLNFESFEVFSDPYSGPKTPAEGRLLRAKAGRLSGHAEMRKSDMDFSNINVVFNESSFDVRGTLKYKPTKLFLRVIGDKVRLEDMLEDFLELPQSGLIKAEATIDYDYERSAILGKTDVFADYVIRDLSVSGQTLGDVSGKAQYLKKILEFRPNLRMGPGTLQVLGRLGRLDSQKEESQLSVYLKAYDYEILVPREGKSPIFDGIFNFETHLQGALNPESKAPFGGKVLATVHSLSSFGVPFERGALEGYVDLSGIRIDKFNAQKGDSPVTLTGFLGGKDSRLDFSTSYLPVRQLGYEPTFERLVQRGEMKLEGFWDQNKGWALDSNFRDLRIGLAAFPELLLKISGDNEEGFTLSAKAKDELSLEYDSNKELVKANLKDKGLFLALSFINKWETVPDYLKIKGEVDFDWLKGSGSLLLSELDFQVTDRWTQNERVLLKLKEPAKIIYSEKRFTGAANFLSGTNSLEILSNGSVLNFKGKSSVRLVDLFVPDFIRLVDGEVDLNGKWEPAKNTLVAHGDLLNVSAYLPFIGTELRSMKGRVTYSDSKLLFESVKGGASDGNVNFNGSYALNSEDIFFKARLNSLPMRFARDLELTATGDVELKGSAKPYLLQGKIRVDRGLLRKEFSGTGLRSSALEQPFLRFDVPFELSPTFQVRNSLLDAYVRGAGMLTGNEHNPNISGRFDVQSGTLFAKDNDFVLTYARVDIPQSTNVDSINVNVQAYTLKNYQSIDYRIFLTAEGDPDDLNLNFRSEPSLSQREVISLITLGYVPQEQTTSSANASQGSSIAQGASAEAFQVLFGQALGKGIQKQTGLEVRVGTSANLRQEDTIPKVTVYRRLSDNVSATFGRSLDVSRPENNFKIDYRLMKHLNLSGVWENPEENRHSLGMDLRLEFEVK